MSIDTYRNAMRATTGFNRGQAERDAARRAVVLVQVSQDVPICPTSEQNHLPSLPEVVGDGLNPEQRVALARLLVGDTFAMAARAAQVDRRTLFRWRQQPAFARVLNEVGREAVDAVAARVRNLMLRATRVMSDVLLEDAGGKAAMRVLGSGRLWALLDRTTPAHAELANACDADDASEAAITPAGPPTAGV